MPGADRDHSAKSSAREKTGSPRKRRTVPPLPDHPKFDWPGPVTIFTKEAADELFKAAQPKVPVDADPEQLAIRLNKAIEEAIGWARRAEMLPKPSELREDLIDFRDSCHALLQRMGLDRRGEPPPADVVKIGPMQGWRQWLRSGFYGLLDAAEHAEPDGALKAKTDLALASSFAEGIVPHSVGREAVCRTALVHMETCEIFPAKDREVAFQSAMVEAALGHAAPILALMAILADAAAARPQGEANSNFEREFLRELFKRFADVWFQTFGEKPSAVNSEREPGGPAFDWHRKVLDHADDMSSFLQADVQAALKLAFDFADRTLVDRIRKGAEQGPIIAEAQQRSNRGE